ncbi:MAG TPA: dihydroorotate dehydrogenase electron transfer subunit [Nocardioidaceae bacterium]|nr:dihydroorotate dehydrogenase electron transfer subunit [Nocardioidaceae bacterium]
MTVTHPAAAGAGSGPLQAPAEVVSLAPVGDYLLLTLSVVGIAKRTRPGQFAALAVGGPQSSMLLRRSFSIYRADPDAETLEIVFAVHGKGTAWLAELRPGDPVDVVGPLGRPYAMPELPMTCVLVGGGYGTAPLFSLAKGLRDRGCAVHLVLGAASEPRLFGVAEAERVADTVTVTTEDGSTGVRGRVTDVLPDLITRTRTGQVYACGPMGMLRAVAAVAADHELPSQCAVEEAMACGVGVCMTCVLPMVGDDGRTRMTRSCVDGPVFAGDRVRWDAVGTVPADTLGAPTGGAH